jgi:hypothetical protein
VFGIAAAIIVYVGRMMRREEKEMLAREAAARAISPLPPAAG